VLLLEQGQELDAGSVTRTIDMVRADESPSRCLHHRGGAHRPGSLDPPQVQRPGRYVQAIRDNVITFGIGPAGTGKSWLAVAAAVHALQTKQVERIILTRPAVEAGERLGFLPGDLMAKVDPYLRPLYDALYDMVDAEGAQKLLDRTTVEVAPLAFMRGRTLNHSFIILDEAQNTTPEQMKMFLTRIGFGSKAVITGDTTQVDVQGGRSGLDGLEQVLTDIDGPGLGEPRQPRRGPAPHRAGHRRRLRQGRGRPGAGTRRASERTSESGRPAAPGVTGPIVQVDDHQSDVALDSHRWAHLAGHSLDGAGGSPRACSPSPSSTRPPSPSSTPPTWAPTAPPTCCRSPSTPIWRSTSLARDLAVPVLLGDVVICPAVAARNAPDRLTTDPHPGAPDHDGSLDAELALLVVHGVLHVLDMDHVDADDAAEMQEAERELLASFAPRGARRMTDGAVLGIVAVAGARAVGRAPGHGRDQPDPPRPGPSSSARGRGRQGRPLPQPDARPPRAVPQPGAAAGAQLPPRRRHDHRRAGRPPWGMQGVLIALALEVA
jgi:rRNA maturation RNase YbeY